jgi:DNA-binding response OmpR family regulator
MGCAVNITGTTSVLCLTKEVVFALDLGDALSGAGLTAFSPVLNRRPASVYRAVHDALVVDADGLDKRGAAIIRRHVRACKPVVMISDSYDDVQRLVVDQTAWFTKPVQTDEVVAFLARWVTRNRAGEEAADPSLPHPPLIDALHSAAAAFPGTAAFPLPEAHFICIAAARAGR